MRSFIERPHPQAPNVKIADPLAIYRATFNFIVKFYNRLSVLVLNRWKWIFWNFVLLCLQYAPTITFYNSELSFLKISLKSILYGLSQGKIIYYFLESQIKMTIYSPFLGNPCIPLLWILCRKHYQCLS